MQYRDIMLLKILVCSPTVMDHQPHAHQIETEKKKKNSDRYYHDNCYFI